MCCRITVVIPNSTPLMCVRYYWRNTQRSGEGDERTGGGDLWSEAEPSGTRRAGWRLKAAKLGVATARSPSRTMPLSFGVSLTRCLISLRLQEYPGDTAGEPNGENCFLPVCHLLEPSQSP